MIPAVLESRLRSQLGRGADAFIRALANAPERSIRINKYKQSSENYTFTDPVPWYEDAWYAPRDFYASDDPRWYAGCYYVQEPSSLILRTFLEIPRDGVVLDLAAAPGGKATLIADTLPEGSVLIANEVIKKRVKILEENVTRWGNPNVVVTSSDAADFKKLDKVFDVIVIDAPCSGEGMIRKTQTAVEEWSPQICEICSLRQKRILSDIWPSLKPGGHLIYSTCTFNPAENEENIKWFLHERSDAEVDAVTGLEEYGFTPVEIDKVKSGGWYAYPHKVRGEGFFISRIKKNGHSINQDFSHKSVTPPADVSSYVENIPPSLMWEGGNGWKVTHSFEKFLQNNGIRVFKGGIAVVDERGQPTHQLALSTICSNRLPKLELSRETALRYLSGEALDNDAGEVGWYRITYEGLPLGLVKAIPARLQNHLPKSWRK